jgi:hypothetical protein
MRIAIVTSEPLDVARGSGTALAIAALRDALRLAGVETAVIAPRSVASGSPLARLRFNRSLEVRMLNRYDAVIGINGDGWRQSNELTVPYVVAVKALYSGAVHFERGVARQELGDRDPVELGELGELLDGD